MKNLSKTAMRALVAGFCFLVPAALALTISGRNSENRNSIFQLGILAISNDLAVTAVPSGSITTAYQITAGLTEVVTVASAGDAVKLPNMAAFTTSAPAHSNDIIVVNHHASNAINMFPFASAEVIVNNGAAGSAGAALSIPALKSAECYAVAGTTNTWFCQIG